MSEAELKELLEALRTIDRFACLEDRIYDVRDRYGGWNAPETMAFGDALKVLRKHVRPATSQATTLDPADAITGPGYWHG